MASGVPPDGKFGSDCFRFNSKMRQPITIRKRQTTTVWMKCQ